MKLLSTLLLTAAATTPVAADNDRTQAVRNLQAPVVAPVGPPMAGGSSPTPAPVPAPVTPPTPAVVVPAPPASDNNVVIPIPIAVTPAPVSPPVAMAQPVTVVTAPVAPAISGDEPAISGDEVISPSIIDLAAADGKYGTLLSAVTNTPGVLDAVVEAFPVTIFGPTDDAFGAIADTVAGLDEATLASILAGHVVAGVFTAEMVIDAGCVELMTLAGNLVRVMVKDGMVMVNDSTVIQPDIIGEGGVIHGIDTVILPGSFMPCPAADAPMTGKGSKKAGGMSSGKGMSGKGSSTKSPSSSGKGSSTKSPSAGKGMSGKGSRRRRA